VVAEVVVDAITVFVEAAVTVAIPVIEAVALITYKKRLSFIGVKLSWMWTGLDGWMDDRQVRKMLVVNPPSSLCPQPTTLYSFISQTIQMVLQVYVQQNRGLSSTKWTNLFKKQMYIFTARWLQPSVGELGRARGSLSLQRQSRHSNPTKGKILVLSLGVSKKEHLALVTVLSLQILSK
jgi:hypothetical protein